MIWKSSIQRILLRQLFRVHLGPVLCGTVYGTFRTGSLRYQKGEKMDTNKFRISKKMRAIIVIAFIAIYALGTYISLRGQYLEYVELGEQYVH